MNKYWKKRIKIKELEILEDVEDVIYNAPLRYNGFCHSFLVYKVPESFGKDYEEYAYLKFKYLYVLFPKIKNSKKFKGFIKLKVF